MSTLVNTYRNKPKRHYQVQVFWVSKQWTTVWSDNPEQAKHRPGGLWLWLQHYNHKSEKKTKMVFSKLMDCLSCRFPGLGLSAEAFYSTVQACDRAEEEGQPSCQSLASRHGSMIRLTFGITRRIATLLPLSTFIIISQASLPLILVTTLSKEKDLLTSLRITWVRDTI